MNLQIVMLNIPLTVLATFLGNLPAVLVQSTKIVQLGPKLLQQPILLPLSGRILSPCQSTHRFGWVWLDPLHQISESVFRIVQFIAAFASHTVNHKILSFIKHYLFWMY